jgi:alpha-N-acetylglucosamine transferase
VLIQVIYLETDMIVLRNMDHVFRLPEVSASGTSQSVFNNGVMVLEPSNCTFQILMDEMEKLVSEVIDVWDFFYRVFPWWHRIPRYMNTLKYFWSTEDKELLQTNR